LPAGARRGPPRPRLTGWEIDPARAEAARRTGAEITVGDFLAAAPEALFDLVAGNPPWVSYSGRHRQDAPERLPKQTGWPSLHSAFMERGAAWLVGGGVLAFVAPRTMGFQRGYARLRERLAAAGRLEFDTAVAQGGFPGVTMPYCVVYWQRAAARAAVFPNRWETIASGADIFSDPGVHTGNAADLILSATERAGWTPMRAGKDVHPYRLDPPSAWVDPSPRLPDDRYATVRGRERYLGTPILLRQTASRPVAALHEPRAYFRNSVLACSGLPGHDHRYLIALLNSRVLAFLHRAINPDSRQKAFPQVKVGGLKRLPLVRATGDGPEPGEAIRLARQWLAEARRYNRRR
jgi:hypothetical protein